MNREKQIEFVSEQLFVLGNMDIIDSVFDDNYVAHDGDKTYTGQKFVSQFIRKLRIAIPDIKLLKMEFLSQTENTISWQRTFSGTHKANMQGIPASNRKVKWTEIVVTRFNGERIAEEWLVSNLAFQLMLKQPKMKQESTNAQHNM
jgi:predicted ester cyclase